MHLFAVQRILGLLLGLFSLTMVPPLAVSWFYMDGNLTSFAIAFALVLGGGIVLWLPVRRHRRELRLRDGFLVVVAFWVVLGLSGAVPFLLLDDPAMTVADAVFEAVSGLTTTGATVITGIDSLPRSLLFYRQMLQWLGGMGIIVLAVAILPVLGIGGLQLYRAETPGPLKDQKLTPRITETAKALWYIYLGLTILCAIGYRAAGMDWFDAVAHSFSTVAIGGFSTHDASLGHFESPAVEGVAMVFMALAGINFALHFVAWRARSPAAYLQDAELRAYAYFLAAMVAAASAYLYATGTFDGALDALRFGAFQAIAFGTTTGFTTSGYTAWPGMLPVLLVLSSFVGACAGSTGGGLKVIRVLLLVKQGMREIHQLIHPNARVSIKVGETALSDRVVAAVWGFFAGYVVVFVFLLLALMASGLDQVTAFSAVAACLNNLGPGLGEVGANYAEIGAGAKLLLSLAMLLGRLEVFTLLVILTPGFWRV